MTLRVRPALQGPLRQGFIPTLPEARSDVSPRGLPPLPLLIDGKSSPSGLRRAWTSRYHGILDDRFVVFGVVLVDDRRRFFPCLYVGAMDGEETVNWGAPVTRLNLAKRVTLHWISVLHAMGLEPLPDPANAGEGEE